MIGVFIVGLTTSFGGGVIRNTIIGVPVIDLWDRETLLFVVGTLLILYIMSTKWIHHWKKWGFFFDSIGLASFSLQGALYASQHTGNLGMTMMAALFTGIGAGVIRDLLAGRKPIALQEEVHAVLALLVGLTIGIGHGLDEAPTFIFIVFFSVVVIRMLAVRYKYAELRENLKRKLRR